MDFISYYFRINCGSSVLQICNVSTDKILHNSRHLLYPICFFKSNFDQDTKIWATYFVTITLLKISYCDKMKRIGQVVKYLTHSGFVSGMGKHNLTYI